MGGKQAQSTARRNEHPGESKGTGNTQESSSRLYKADPRDPRSEAQAGYKLVPKRRRHDIEDAESDSEDDAVEMKKSSAAQFPLLKLLDLVVEEHDDQYICSSTIRATIREIVQRILRDSPRVLINTSTGRLHDRAEQASSFESLPIFNELASSTTTPIDYVQIKHEVRQHFKYVMLSHVREENEPLFHQVIHTAVYGLDKSPAHDKLQTFCKIVRDAGFNWAWSDTCCIDRSDHFVLQEALVSLFEWYRGCALMIVFLRGVQSSSQLGALAKSSWNTCAWTLQEYIAAKVIHFYTEDWTPYLNLELPNHKESWEVISEMETVTRLSVTRFMALRPGLTNIREKLRLASTRETAIVEDAAYSLFGIFSVTSLETIYGEGEKSLGRLLAQILTGSGDASILAWTGRSGSFNSCLPAHIVVFNKPATSHLPRALDTEIDKFTTASLTFSPDPDVALSLYDRLSELPAPWFAANRMKLPCIAFQLPALCPCHTHSTLIYRVDTPTFGMVDITTTQDLSLVDSLYLVHPWLDCLLEHGNIHGNGFVGEDDVVPPPTPPTDSEEIPDDELEDCVPLLGLTLPSHGAPDVVLMDRETLARRLVARLRQPFGALLLAPAASNGRGTDYKRVAADCSITVQFQEDFSLTDVLDNIRILNVV